MGLRVPAATASNGLEAAFPAGAGAPPNWYGADEAPPVDEGWVGAPKLKLAWGAALKLNAALG